MGLHICVILISIFSKIVTGYIIGEACRYDVDCFVENSYCLRQEVCECKENFLASPDYRFCIATIGAICNSKHDCNSLPNSICYEENCLCDRGFVPDPHNANCKPVSSGLRGPCEFDSQCYPTMGESSICSRGSCDCLPGYAFLGKCIKLRSIGDSCVTNQQCYRNNTYHKNVTACINHVCKCIPGYTLTSNGDCVSSGITNGPQILLIAITILIAVSKITL